eukprot:EG_transcript_61776
MRAARRTAAQLASSQDRRFGSRRHNTTLGVQPSVEQHTVVTEVPGLRLPGDAPLRLRLITPACPLYHARDDADLPYNSPPWWAFVWPGGYGQSRFALHRPAALA